MILEYLLSDISILQLPKCPLVHNFGISGVIEYRGRDPGLSFREINQGNVRKKEEWRRTSRTSHPPRLTPRIFSEPYGKLELNAKAAGGKQASAATVAAAVTNTKRRGMGSILDR
jgi:hypothetical protein